MAAAPAYIRPADLSQTTADRVLRRWRDMRDVRQPWEASWDELCRHFLPRRTFELQKWPGELRDRRLLDATGMINADRFASMIFAFLVSQNVPFVRPNVNTSLVAAGRDDHGLDDDSRDWLDGVQWAMHDHFMSVRSGFKTSGYECLAEYAVLGNGIFWTGGRQGFGAYYQARPLQSCWFAVNADGVVDTLYYAFTLPAHRVAEKWPKAAELPSVERCMAAGGNPHAAIRLLLACEPRQHGRVGAAAFAKPFASYLIVAEDKALIEESGYDSFPYAVPRFYVRPGETYAYGPGHIALPEARLLNAIMESVLRGAELAVDPPMMAPLRLFSKTIQRRPGVFNYYQAGQLGLQTADQAVRPLSLVGDVRLGVEFIKELRAQIEFAFWTDWLKLRENAEMTATEVNDRRDMRLRGLAPIVGRAESEFMGPVADRTFDINAGEGLFGEPPQGLAGHNITWTYTGPMALAQLQGQRDAVLSTVGIAGEIMKVDPKAAQAIDGEELLRISAEATGLPPTGLRTRAAVAQIRQQQDAAEAAAAGAQNDAQGAQALRDGAQGVASLVSAMDGGQRKAA